MARRIIAQLDIDDEDEEIADPGQFIASCNAAIQPLATGNVKITIDMINTFDDDYGT